MKSRCPHCRFENEPDVDECVSCRRPAAFAGDETVDFGRTEVSKESDAPHTLGRFRLTRELGRGAFGSVWLARDPALDRAVAVKVPNRIQDESEADAFFREARAAAQLRHPNIVAVHEVGREGGQVYIVSEYIEGTTLEAVLKARRVDLRAAAELCATVADGLHYAHEKGVVHRDLKPANIMIGTRGEPYVMDFGLAKLEVGGEASISGDDTVMGTPMYMPPEQAAGRSRYADRRSDVYSLGVTFYTMLTNEPPFRGNLNVLLRQIIEDEPPPPRKLDQRIPLDLDTICLKCMQKDPIHRYQTAADLAADLRLWLAGEPIRARPVSATERLWRWCRRKPVLAALSAASALLLLATLAATSIGYLLVSEANGKTREKYRESLVGEAAALRRSRAAGARDRALAAILEASAVRPGPDLRDEAVNCFELAELKHLRTIELPGPARGADFWFLPGGRVLLRSDDGGLAEYSVETGVKIREVVLPEKSSGPAALTDDGSTLVAAGENGEGVALWNLALRRKERTLGRKDGRPLQPRLVAVDDTGSTVAVVAAEPQPPAGRPVEEFPLNERLSIHDARTGELISSFRLRNTKSVVLLKGGKWAAALSEEKRPPERWMKTIQLLDVASGTSKASVTLDVFKGAASPFRLAYHRFSNELVAGDLAGELKSWNVDTASASEVFTIGRTIPGHSTDAYLIACAPGRPLWASAGSDGMLRVLDSDHARLLVEDRVPRALLALKWSGESLVLGVLTEKGLRLYEFQPPKHSIEPIVPEMGRSSLVEAFAFSRDGRSLAVKIPGETSGLKLVDLTASRRKARTLEGFSARLLTFSPRGDVLAGCRGGAVVLHPLDGVGKSSRHPLAGVEALCLAEDGACLATTPHGSGVAVWDVLKNQKILTLDSEAGGGLSSSFAADGRWLVVGETKPDGSTITWRVVDLKTLATAARFIAPAPSSIAVSASGRLALKDGTRIRLYERLDDAQFRVVGVDSAVSTESMAFDSDGRILAELADADGEVRIWDVRSAALALRLPPTAEPVDSIALDPLGRWLLYRMSNNRVYLRDLGTTLQSLTEVGAAR